MVLKEGVLQLVGAIRYYVEPLVIPLVSGVIDVAWSPLSEWSPVPSVFYHVVAKLQ